MTVVEVNNLKKLYGSLEAIKGINFTIEEGEIFGLIGPNGAGKTTTLRIVSTLLRPSSGTVKIFGYDVVSNPGSIRKLISYLPEDAGAYKNLTGIDYLAFIARFFASGNKMREMIERGIKIANLGDRINDKIDTYSKGMMRRLLVARALMTKPKLAILDEPTSGLDVLNSQEVRKIIKDSVKSGVTVLLSSHNMLEVEFLCDRIALINNGLIVETGTPRELMAKYDSQNVEEVFIEVIRCSGTS
ncbi:MAG: ABC transporter ATP-binding protein [Thermotogae bacterium]|nr:ABC transporter ATP-binding protein [Thermotogota bacterium]